MLSWTMVLQLATLLFHAPPSWASSACQANDRGKPSVVFFGGNAISDDQATAWAVAAQDSPKYGAHFRFEGHSLHFARHEKDEVLKMNSEEIDSCARRINSDDFRGPLILVGHSDGSWVIHAIAQKVSAANRSKLKLVNLDGWAPTGVDLKNVDIQCWRSKKRGEPSKPCACQPCHYLIDDTCESNTCSHYKVVNINVASDLSPTTYATKGYDRVVPPLQFLDRYMAPLRGTLPASFHTH